VFPDVAGADPDRVRAWLLDWLHQHPPRQLCQLRDDVRELPAADLNNEAALSKLLFRLVQECRGAYLTCACPGCAGGPGVPLARVWLRVDPDDRRCHVETVDADPPFRRSLQTDCWPAPPGSVNAGQVLWHRWPEACTTLADLGIEVAGTVEFTLPPTLDELGEALNCSPFLACGRPAVAQLYDAGRLGRRVVGFCGGPVTPSLALRVVKTAQVASAAPGELVPYLVDVANTGDAALRVQLNDDQVGPVGDTRLDVGASQRFRYPFQVPADAKGTLDNTVTVTGSAADGRSVTERASHSLPVAMPATPVGISLTKTADPTTAAPGQGVVYSFTVENTSADATLTVEVHDNQLGEVTSGQPIATGQSRTFTKDWQVPVEATEDITNVATATGTTGDGRTASGTASFTLGVATAPSRLGLKVIKRGPGFTEPGAEVTYEVEVANTGEEQLVVEVVDDLIGPVAADQIILPGDFGAFQEVLAVTDQTPAEVINVVTATGVAADGRTVVATGSHLLHVAGGLPQPVEDLGDLTEIAGIAQGRAETLRNAGIASLADLAAATTERLRELFPGVGQRALQGWIDQARERRQR
jgi:predicted flap endonuclease-1-like 5' DNA nuclease